jgi:hypothetical protein
MDWRKITVARILDWGVHDPDEAALYIVDWTDRLGTSETISTSAFTYTGSPDTTPLVLSSAAISTDNLKTQIKLDNGTSGTLYTVNNRVTTSASNTLDQSVYIRVRTR